MNVTAKSQANFWLLVPLLSSVLLFSLYLFGRWGSAELQHLILALGYNLVTLFAALSCLFFVKLHQGKAKRGWFFMALGLLAITSGDVLWNYYDLILHIEPYPSLADICYVTAPLLFVLAFIFFPRDPLKPIQSLQVTLDVAICVIAAAVFLWPSQFVPIIKSYGDFSLELLLSLIYPTLDLILLSLLFSITLRNPKLALGADKVILSMGLIAIISADFSFSALGASNSYYNGHPIDALWLWGYSFLALSAYISHFPQGHHNWRWLESLSLRGIATFVPYIAIILSYGFSLFFHSHKGLTETGTSIGTGLVTLLVVIRQVVAFRENQGLTRSLKSLSEDLERRVELRTKELEESRNRLLASEKLASLGRLTAGLAHEINTPLAAARNSLLQAKTLSEEYQDSIDIPTVTAADHHEIASELGSALKQADHSLERLGEFVRRMKSQTRSSGMSVDFDPLKVTEDSLAMLEHRARKVGCQLRLEPVTEALLIHGDPSRFNQVISNLIVNAMDACEDTDKALKEVKIHFAVKADNVILRIQDNGSGISPEALPNIFEPMFTTKEVGKGTGLGLSIVHNIITGHFAGDIHVETTSSEGTTFSLKLPQRLSQKQKTPLNLVAI